MQPGSGAPRVEPGETDPNKTASSGDTSISRSREGLTPSFLRGANIKRAAVVLPFSHPNAQVRTEAESMLAGIELALFEFAGEDMLVMPYDNAGSASLAEARTDEAIKDGADIVLGPLFGDNVASVRKAAERRDIPVVAFSNNRKVAGGGAYLASILPEEEVARITSYAAAQGVRTFVFLGPETDYGRQVESALRIEAGRVGGLVIKSAFYDPKASASDQVREAAAAIKAEQARAPGKIAVMIPEKGTKMVQIAPLLAYNGVSMTKVMLIGTSQWNDSAIWREPALQGAVFASTDPSNLNAFRENFQRQYGRKPSDLAAIAYDAAAMAVRLAKEDNLKYNGITDPDGFMGVNGLFRFRLDGTAQRGLAVMQIQPGGPTVVEAGIKQFREGES
jgi:hypothetical protein